ncbi:long-chain fatty acid--CoA ligase [Acidiferrimicrobium sp. IK]|uniref:acyl-CoA synthetase n=1 Tax=Acidiferrimicrobium sp. IK TaxID=2871700 RepID=UPI0021CAF8B5|nr:long-chain fatty acid--CoA ligase [Acidiferrimicrobium sp. IK]MCU4182842.1 long-chain fatty acid--CoA ligase [Acidiferrimicrobium sp. IK]
MDRGIGSWVTKRAWNDGDRVALVEGERACTYDDFDQRTDRLSQSLLRLGVRRGDRVALLMYNSAAFMETLFAVAKLGAIAVPVNFRLAPPEVGYILADSGADVLVHHGGLADLARRAVAEEGVRVRHRLVDPGPLGGDGWRPDTGELPYEAVLQDGPLRPVAMDVDQRDVHGIMYTSGTTGRPKGAMLTHANAIANAINNATYGRGLRQGDVTVTAAPMFHIGGLGVHTMPLVFVGGTTVIQAAFVPERCLAAMAEVRASVQFLVPAMWAAITRVADFDRYDLSSLELCLSGGAPTPLPVLDFFAERGVPFQEGFGMTETSPSVSVLDADSVRERAGSIGRPLPAVEARLVDEYDREVPPGTVGELVLQGDNIFAGYWMLPRATEEAFRGGWFHTGDLGRVDEEGFITLVDRKKDMIITGGENVYPVEVEQILVRHPAVVEVAVFGVPDGRWGETVVAAVSVSEQVSAEDLIVWARERMAHFKAPTRVELLDELPRNATGKVLKTQLRAAYGGTEAAVSR